MTQPSIGTCIARRCPELIKRRSFSHQIYKNKDGTWSRRVLYMCNVTGLSPGFMDGCPKPEEEI